jgi:hypothetical protein
MKKHRVPSLLLATMTLFLAPIVSRADFFSVGVAVALPPPPLPAYEQPVLPGEGYVWIPGYWAYDDDEGYYWVPGMWTLAPGPGLLWTPGYWAWAPGGFVWNAGYWGPRVGFYGGINYGFGYFGIGFTGGYWNHGEYCYNRAVTNINVTNISTTTVYYNSTANYVGGSRASYNGGEGGIRLRPSPADLAAARAPHFGATSAQRQQASLARSLPTLAASANRGQPPIAATPTAGTFQNRGITQARGTAAPARADARPMGHGAYVGNADLHGPGRATPYGSAMGTRGAEPTVASARARADRPTWATPRSYQSGSPFSNGANAAARRPAYFAPPFHSDSRSTPMHAYGYPPSNEQRRAFTSQTPPVANQSNRAMTARSYSLARPRSGASDYASARATPYRPSYASRLGQQWTGARGPVRPVVNYSAPAERFVGASRGRPPLVQDRNQASGPHHHA